jgi:hypothetical protein
VGVYCLNCHAREERTGRGGGQARRGSRLARRFETKEERGREIEGEADRGDRLVGDCGEKEKKGRLDGPLLRGLDWKGKQAGRELGWVGLKRERGKVRAFLFF